LGAHFWGCVWGLLSSLLEPLPSAGLLGLPHSVVAKFQDTVRLYKAWIQQRIVTSIIFYWSRGYRAHLVASKSSLEVVINPTAYEKKVKINRQNWPSLIDLKLLFHKFLSLSLVP
jgi:hypothetical protein